jgi:formylglycine-generating enzyme required for sulfatase activity
MNKQVALAGLVLVLLGAAPAGEPAATERILGRFLDEFVSLNPGKDRFPASFEMGSADGPDAEKPVRTVAVKPFQLGKYEVTQELYEAVMGKNPSRWKGPRNSVEVVNWYEAADFCRKATAQLQRRKLLAEGDLIRLPTEAEWEYACRAGTKTRYSFGDDVKLLTEYAWFTGNAAGNDPPVGKKKPNPWGLYDMHGYVWEWCQDAWHPTYQGAPADGSARDGKDVKERVIRGGAWTEKPDTCRSAARGMASADFRSEAVGFRCVLQKK